MQTAGFDQGRPVKMTKAGNSKMLPVPADVVRSLGAELGDEYVVQVVGEDLVYHRNTAAAAARVRIVGEGADRAGVLPRHGAAFAGNAPSLGLLDDWDF
jgi:antitoxin component of MazEF toxin-antitoxin module